MENTMKIKKLLCMALPALLMVSTFTNADAGRYQAYWNGKNYLIMDTDRGYMWTYFGDTIMYNGRIDGDDFNSPDKAKIWQQSHGKWIQK
jgi:hypothetical protein